MGLARQLVICVYPKWLDTRRHEPPVPWHNYKFGRTQSMQKRNKRRRRISRTSFRLRLTNPVLHFEVRSTTHTDPLFAQNASPVRKYLPRQGRYRLLLLSQPSHHKVSRRRGADDHLDFLTSKCWYTSINIRLDDDQTVARAPSVAVALPGWLPGSRTQNIRNIWPQRSGRSLGRARSFGPKLSPFSSHALFLTDERAEAAEADGAMTK